MSRMALMVIGAAIIALVLADVVEIQFHPERLSHAPATLRSALQDQTLLEHGRAQAVSLKRYGEQLIVRDEIKRLELAVLYVQEDAERLQQLASEEGVKAEMLMPQAKLLLASAERVRSLVQDAPVKVVADVKDESREAFTQAYAAYTRMREINEEYKTLQEKFMTLTAALEEQIAGFTESSEKETSEIPLKF